MFSNYNLPFLHGASHCAVVLSALILSLPFVSISAPVRSNLGGDGEEYSDVKTYTAADYIQDGLVAMWDGIENVGWEVHDATSRVWVNLVDPSKYTLTLGNSTWKGNALNHTATGQYGAAYLSGESPRIPDDVHWEFICHVTGATWTNSGGTLFFYNRSTRSDITAPVLNVGIRNANDRLYGAGTRTATRITPYPTGYFAFSVGYRIIWINGESQTLLSSGQENDWPDARLTFFGRYGQYTYNTYGDIFCVRVYSRELTPEEIRYNYLIDKARFGL